MSRSATEIYNSLIQTKESDPNLDSLDSTSLTAIWRLFLYVEAVGISLFEQVFDSFLLDMEFKIENTPVNSKKWYNNQMISYFQYNVDPAKGELIIDPTTFIPGYEIEDDPSKIIEYAATTENNRNVTIKVAKQVNNLPETLSPDELISAASFVDRIKPVGTIANVVSFVSDKILLDVEIYYNGSFVSTDLQAQIEENIQAYFLVFFRNVVLECYFIINCITSNRISPVSCFNALC